MSAIHATAPVPFAWAGFSLQTPAHWEVVALERDFVRFENDRGPRLECRWQHTEGSYRLDRRLTKAASQVKRAATIRAGSDDAPLPEPFTRAMEELSAHGFQTRTFGWTERAAHAPHPGALLHHDASDTALILRAFPPKQPADDEELASGLATMRCHPRDSERPWAVFGMRAFLPGRLALKTFSFKPGHYRLQFTEDKRTSLALERLGPAQLVLKGEELTAWARQFYKNLNLHAAQPAETHAGWTVLEKPWPRGLRGGLARVLPGFLRARSFRLALRLADLESKVLAVRMEGPRPLTDEEFHTVCERYEIL
ncbi:MAG: hypothetical protein ACOCWR_00485 [Oceanidesulfovibrio sp.]